MPDSVYDGWGDVRQSRDLVMKIAKPLLDAGWTTHLNEFFIYGGNKYVSYLSKFVLVLKSPDNLFAIGFLTSGASSTASITHYLYSAYNIPSTIDELSTKPRLSLMVATIQRHKTIPDICYTVIGLVNLRNGGFLVYILSGHPSITNSENKYCFGILPCLVCSSNTFITNVFLSEIVNVSSSLASFLKYAISK